jgi:chemotaxis protein methyltransferase CheR
MSKTITDSLLGQFSRFVEANMGLSFPEGKWAELERGTRSAACEFGFGDAEACIQWLMSSRLSKGQVEILASHLTVGETYFFRDGKCFDILQEHIVPGLVRARAGKEQNIRIWSAGCATGEEPYSAAILLNRAIPDLKNWNITILATDINPRFLRKAKEGVYGEWSFRETPGWVRENFFTKTKKELRVREDIRNMVTFSYHNINEDPFPSFSNNTNAMDIIFCRNVLMYFSQKRARDVIHNFYRCLGEDGWLIVSAVEASQVLFSEFRTMNFPGLTLYRKTETIEKAPPVNILPSPIEIRQAQATEFRQKIPEIQTPVQAPISPEPGPVPSLPDFYQEALRSYEQGHYAAAVEKLTKSTGDESGLDAKAMSLLARAYANQGKLSDAVEWCEKAISADRVDPGSHYLLATVLQEQGQTGEAVASLKRTLYLDQDFVPAHFLLGNLARQQGKLRESRKHFENTLSILKAYRQEDILPESEGMTAGRLNEIIQTMIETAKPEVII